jgi:antitoxin component YwqK of YwqJK toxin-antitoxin module
MDFNIDEFPDHLYPTQKFTQEKDEKEVRVYYHPRPEQTLHSFRLKRRRSSHEETIEEPVLVKKAQIQNEKLSGSYQIFYPNGVLWIDTAFLQDKLHGLYKEFTEKGILIHITFYYRGIQNGLSRHFYRNGNLKGEMTLLNGEVEGTAIVYSLNKKRRLVRQFLGGELISEKECFD